jgi:uncharacterized YccA/Bax inhibitor family protein
VIWALLLLVGLFGGTVLGLPQMMTATAGTIAVLAAAFLIPAGTLYVMLLERRLGAVRRQGSSALAIRRRWRYAIAGGWATLLGVAVLLPSTQMSSWIKVAGAVLLVWGLLCLFIAALAFRMKPWLADARRIR